MGTTSSIIFEGLIPERSLDYLHPNDLKDKGWELKPLRYCMQNPKKQMQTNGR